MPIKIKGKNYTKAEQAIKENPSDRAEVKFQVAKNFKSRGKFQRLDNFEIEIVNSEPIKSLKGTTGIKIFARVFEKGKQIGFGKNGDVDIEVFNILNFPVLVDDEKGDIIKEWTDEAKKLHTRTLKEDPQEAILQALEHTISVKKQKFDDKDIVKGKVGNTTTTVYPDDDAGLITTVLGAGGWDAAHDASSADSEVASYQIKSRKHNNDGSAQLTRYGVIFDTSAIGTDTIDSATMSIYVEAKDNNENDGNDFISIVSATTASDSDVAVGDWDTIGDAINNPTEMHDSGQRKDITSISTGAYTDWTFNSTGEGNIDGSGYSKFGSREGHDILDDELDGGNDQNGIDISEVEYAGTSQDPKLVVEHSSPAVGRSWGQII